MGSGGKTTSREITQSSPSPLSRARSAPFPRSAGPIPPLHGAGTTSRPPAGFGFEKERGGERKEGGFEAKFFKQQHFELGAPRERSPSHLRALFASRSARSLALSRSLTAVAIESRRSKAEKETKGGRKTQYSPRRAKKKRKKMTSEEKRAKQIEKLSLLFKPPSPSLSFAPPASKAGSGKREGVWRVPSRTSRARFPGSGKGGASERGEEKRGKEKVNFVRSSCGPRSREEKKERKKTQLFSLSPSTLSIDALLFFSWAIALQCPRSSRRSSR